MIGIGATPKSKYVIVEGGSHPIPLVFSDLVSHDCFIHSGMKVIAAGYCYIENNVYVCYGRSATYQLNARPVEDAETLNRYLGAIK